VTLLENSFNGISFFTLDDILDHCKRMLQNTLEKDIIHVVHSMTDWRSWLVSVGVGARFPEHFLQNSKFILLVRFFFEIAKKFRAQ
jgi:hypothetical protein